MFMGAGPWCPGEETDGYTKGSRIKARTQQTHVWKSAARRCHYEGLTFDGDFNTTDAVFLFDFQTKWSSMERCCITRTLIPEGKNFTVSVSPTDTIECPEGHDFSIGDKVYFRTTETLPTELYQNGGVPNCYMWVYYVVSTDDNTFKVALTEGGPVIMMTTNGSGKVWKYGGDLLKIGCNPSINVDTSSIRTCQIIQDFSDMDSAKGLAGRGITMIGTNTCCWHIDTVEIWGCTDSIWLEESSGNGPHVRFTNCFIKGVSAVSRSYIVKSGKGGSLTWENGLVETDAMPFIVELNVPFEDMRTTWRIRDSYFNSAAAHIIWSCRQPLLLEGNTLGGNIAITATGGQFVTTVGDTFQTERGAMAFTGDVNRVIRVAQIEVDGSIVNAPTQAKSPTSSIDESGVIGSFAWDEKFLYIKTSGGWKRAGVSLWKRIALEQLPEVFENGSPQVDGKDQLIERLCRQIGQLQVELDWI